MDGKFFFDALGKILSITSNGGLAKAVGKLETEISKMKGKPISPLVMARMMAKQINMVVQVNDLFEALKRRLEISTDKELASRLGMTQNTLVNWKNSSNVVNSKKIVDLVTKAQKQAANEAMAFKPVIEFFPIQRTPKSATSKEFHVFKTDSTCSKQCAGLREELDKTHGLYIFYDARGKALYVGKAVTQSIWKEMNLAFNRVRNRQIIFTVKHPTNNIAYKPAHEKLRQPVDTPRKLVDLAAYFSAYDTATHLIDHFEALLIRAFPNDLLNRRIEKIKPKRKNVNKTTLTKK